MAINPYQSVSGNGINFDVSPVVNPAPVHLNAEQKRDCIIEVETCRDFEHLDPRVLDLTSRKVGLNALEQILKSGRPAVVIFLPEGMKWETSNRETMMQNLARLSQTKPIILVAQGGK